ncbi:hypothetical protein M427DRAFT_130412 [Gonapodya prolifera JEL478]|uniref:Uncharacterized protein n=1 Tax=Gonapodya prolifera (strain JEL478) TaxID=1344416 RepID=A0A139AY85_GONPJ|nr:hypothetical protein M427DRAFT_130412 [Gonapodya prolifera JEL478]|eukprot:KXS21667.1 hypothetical protein M427DRAFT_130412 [Gonapodya prolifera JEL478]
MRARVTPPSVVFDETDGDDDDAPMEPLGHPGRSLSLSRDIAADDVHLVASIGRVASLPSAIVRAGDAPNLKRAPSAILNPLDEIGPTAVALARAAGMLSGVLEEWIGGIEQDSDGDGKEEAQSASRVPRVVITLADYFASLDVAPVCDCTVEFENVRGVESAWEGIDVAAGGVGTTKVGGKLLTAPPLLPHGVSMFADNEDRDAVAILRERQADEFAFDENPARWAGFLECSDDESEREPLGIRSAGRSESTPDMKISHVEQSENLELELSQLTLVSTSLSVPRKLGLVWRENAKDESEEDDDDEVFHTAPNSPTKAPHRSRSPPIFFLNSE